MRLAQGDPEPARAAIQRFEALLEERPSLWYATVLRRLDGFALFLEARLDEARRKLESVRSAFRLLGDVTELAMAELGLAIVARESGAADAVDRLAAAVRTLEALGILNATRIQRVVPGRAHAATWSEATVCERLVVALQRLSLRGLRAEQLRGEIVSSLKDLFPRHAATVAPATPDEAAARDGVLIPDGQGGFLRVSVEGGLSAEQRAALRLFKALVPANAVAPMPRQIEPDNDASLPGFIAAAPATRRLSRPSPASSSPAGSPSSPRCRRTG
jgi:hypothetical protein